MNGSFLQKVKGYFNGAEQTTFPFPRELFWDVDPDTLDLQENAHFIIGRVLDFGDVEDFKKIKQLYGLGEIKKAAMRHPFESAKSKEFWERTLDLSPHSLSCTRKLSHQIPSAFLRRSEPHR